MGLSAGEPAVHDFDGMEGVDAGAVKNLLSAGGAGCGHEGGSDGVGGVALWQGAAQGGEEDQPNEPAMPQHPEWMMWRVMPLSRRSMAAVFSMPTSAFWWQWPWSHTSTGRVLNCSARMLPRATSRMMNSS